MGYVKQLFSPGQVLTAEHMNHIEDGLENHDWQIKEFIDFMNEINKTGGGVGIKSIEQTETSYGSGGINIITVTLTDGTVRDFEIRNGQSGQKGEDGVDGLTPTIEVEENYTSNTGKSGVLIKVTQPWWGIDETGADVVLTNIYEVPIFHGSDGQNAKIAIVNVESLDAGSTPSATVSNTPAGAIITLKIPQGDPGKDGTDGKDGSDGFSPTVGVSKSGKTTTITITDKNGAKSATINDGEDGQRGHGILKVTTTPTSYTTTTGGKAPIKRMSLSTIKSEANVDEVLVGDQICHSYYLYNVYYLDATYAYMDKSQSIRGASGQTGSAGKDGVDGKDGYLYVTQVGYNALTAEELAQHYADGVRLVIVTDGYTNQVPISTDENGDVYCGCGYRKNCRLTSGGELEDSSFACVTGYIPYANGDTIRIVGAEGSIDTFGNYLAFYKASHELIAVYYMSVAVRESGGVYEHWKDGIHMATIPTNKMTGSYATTCSDAAYIRVSFNPCVGRNLIVTTNEEIPEV